jgi:uncharacterized membrane protein YedE/YeeE
MLPALLGGVLIGLAIAMLLLLNGRVAGISGILGGLVRPEPGEGPWRWLFVLGLVGGGLVVRALQPSAIEATEASLPILVASGLLVGLGTRLANGCTSGHGVCGNSRLSPRSLVATGTFMAVGAAVVFLVRHGATP